MFELRTWGEIAELKYGKAMSGYRDDPQARVPVYGTNGAIGLTQFPHVDRPGVIIGRKGAYRGVHYSPVPFSVIDTAFYLEPHAGIDNRWAYYALQLADINGLDSGSAIPSTSREAFYSIPVRVPAISHQQAMARVLGALDDKIDANAVLAETLDAYFMARWAKVSAGAVWSHHRLSDLVSDVIGGDWGTSESVHPSTEQVFCIRGADITDLQGSGLGNMPRRFVKPNSLRRRRLAGLDLVVEMSGGSPTQSTGRAVLITDALLKRLKLPLSSSNFCRIVRLGDRKNAYLVYALLRDSWSRGEFFQFENGSTGIKNLAFSDFCAAKEVAMPSNGDLDDFNQLADGLFKQMQSFGEESARLARTRDALLPQLMSGNLRVQEAELLVEAAL